MRLTFVTAVLAALATQAGAVRAQAVRLTESFEKDRQYHVSCQVEIAGELPMPAGQGPPSSKLLKVSGRSSLKYDERILRVTPDKRIDRTLRYYSQMDFQRKVGDADQQNQLRPEVRRLVILRHKQYEVPFCPTGPLTWGEIDLVRTDVFVPALVGLFPVSAVHVGDRWSADDAAIQELTDLEKIEKTDFVCTLEKVTTLLGRRNAHVNFEGKVQGIGEDGRALHELRGSYYVDLDANFLSYIYVKGTHHLLNKDGVATGKVDGTFVLTRTQAPQSRELTDESIRGLILEPGAENTLLLFDQPQVGLRFLYPRNWRVAGANNKQIGVDEAKGSGMLITLSPGAATPNGAQFHQETLTWLNKQQAKVSRDERPRTVQPGMETFLFEGELAREKVILQYFTIRQENNGATIAVRLTAADVNTVQREADRIARSVQLTTPK